MKNILIIESEFSGHYLTGYIKYVLRALKDKKKINIILLISDLSLSKGKGALKILKDEKVNFKIQTFSYIYVKNFSKVSLIKYQFNFYFKIKKEFKKLNKIYMFDHIFLSSIQRFDKALSILGSPFENTKFSGVILGMKFHLEKYKFQYNETSSIISKYLFYKLLKIKYLKFLITNDVLLKNHLNKYKKNLKNKLIFLHDPKEFRYKLGKRKARDLLRLSSKSFVILVYGSIIDSKGIIQLLDIFKNKINLDVKVIIAGDQFDQIKYYLKKKFVRNLINNNQVQIISGWQNEYNEAKLFFGADVIWIGYEDYPFPSGVLYQSIAANRPAIISNNGFIFYLNKIYKVGHLVNINNPKDIIHKLYDLKDNKKNIKLQKAIKHFHQISKPDNWVNVFKKNIFK